jgi:hypothetical protein
MRPLRRWLGYGAPKYSYVSVVCLGRDPQKAVEDWLAGRARTRAHHAEVTQVKS